MQYILLYATAVIAFSARMDDKQVTYLVKARVVNISDITKNGSTAKLEVVHVYSGDSSLIGKVFRDTQQFASVGGGTEAINRFELNEESIWSVSLREGALVPTVDPSLPFILRSRKVDNPSHANNIALADAIERLGKLNGKDFTNALIELINDPVPQVSTWAVRRLSVCNTIESNKVFDAFCTSPNDKLPIASQIEFDKLLAKTKKDDWLLSSVRISLLRSWVKRRVDEYDAKNILRRFNDADLNGELPNNLAIELAQIVSLNEDLSLNSRRVAIMIVGQIASHGVDDEVAYNWLFEQVKKNGTLEFRRAAAASIGNHITLNNSRLKAIEAHLLIEQDLEVQKMLMKALAKERLRK